MSIIWPIQDPSQNPLPHRGEHPEAEATEALNTTAHPLPTKIPRTAEDEAVVPEEDEVQEEEEAVEAEAEVVEAIPRRPQHFLHNLLQKRAQEDHLEAASVLA